MLRYQVTILAYRLAVELRVLGLDWLEVMNRSIVLTLLVLRYQS